MSDSVKELINHLANNRNRQAEKTFMSVMDKKVGAAIRAKEPQVAQSMFNKKGNPKCSFIDSSFCSTIDLSVLTKAFMELTYICP